MLKRLFTVAFTIVALAGLAGTSHEQYLYLDSNGDGVWTTADRMNANGVATVVDAWINTNHNRDNSLATCDTADGDLGFWNSYAIDVGVRTGTGTVTFTNFINQQPNFNLMCVGVGIDFLANSTEMTACRATATSEAGTLKRMFTVTITGQTGAPIIDYLPLGNLSPNFSSFGTPCSGNDFDNTYKLGSDFFDSDGLAAAAAGNANPAFDVAGGQPPATRNGAEGTAVSITARLTDPDATNQLTITQTNNATFLTGRHAELHAGGHVHDQLDGARQRDSDQRHRQRDHEPRDREHRSSSHGHGAGDGYRERGHADHLLGDRVRSGW